MRKWRRKVGNDGKKPLFKSLKSECSNHQKIQDGLVSFHLNFSCGQMTSKINTGDQSSCLTFEQENNRLIGLN